MKYVDKSRKAADAITAEDIFTACKVAATEESITAKFTATWDGSTLAISEAGADAATTLLGNSLGLTFTTNSATLVSKYKGTKDAYAVTYTPGASGSEGTVKVTASGWFS